MASTLEERVEALERELETVKKELASGSARKSDSQPPWWERIAGTFEGDQAHQEAMALGREYRVSLVEQVAGDELERRVK